MNLIEGYKQSANNDLEIIESLAIENKNILIFYHIQQAFEKLLKVIFLKTLTLNSELKIKKILDFRHKIEDITFDLMVLVCDEYIIQFKSLEKASEDYGKFVKLI